MKPSVTEWILMWVISSVQSQACGKRNGCKLNNIALAFIVFSDTVFILGVAIFASVLIHSPFLFKIMFLYAGAKVL